MIRTLLLLGATGDLARRYLLPALGALHQDGLLPDGFRVVGGARSTLDPDEVQRLAGNDLPADVFTYQAVDLGDPSSLAALVGDATGPVAAYLALPPAAFPPTIESLGQLDLPAGSRIIVEKPFGDDEESARSLNELLAGTGLDPYRVDHVLGMEPTANLIALRRDAVVDRLWSANAVEQVEIRWEETIALEGRAGYFDHAGMLVDVLQNHMLQLLALTAMEPATDDELQERKLEALRAVRVVDGSRRARYTAGTLADGRTVPAYVDEDGVDPDRGTETFCEVSFEVGTPRWRGTRFVLRTGKALAERRKLVVLRFRSGGELEVGIDGPEDLLLRLAGAGGTPVELRGPAPGRGLPAYAHVLLDALGGTSTLSVGGDEAVELWRVVAPILATWDAGDVPMEEYEAGSAGP